MRTPRISRLVLIPDTRPGLAPESAAIRRYRLARLSVNEQPPPGGGRHEYLKRIHD